MPINEDQKHDLTLPQHFLAGGIAGVIESVACHPLDTIKIRMQVGRVFGINPLPAARIIYKTEGMLGFYRGLSAVVVGVSPKMAIRFSSFEAAKRYLSTNTNNNNNKGSSNSTRNFLAGLVAGTTETLTVVNPMEVVKIRMQTDPMLRNAGHALVSIVQREGARALYRGASLTATRQAINQAVNFTVYHDIKARLSRDEGGGGGKVLPSYQHFLIGAISGSLGPISNAPIDTLKTQVQAARRRNGANGGIKVGIPQLALRLYREEGILAFFKGITPRLLRIAPGQAVTFTVYEKMSQFLQTSTERSV